MTTCNMNTIVLILASLSQITECVFSDWSVWSECSLECGSGTKGRTRTCTTAPCFGANTETTPCTQLCGCQLSPCGDGGTCIQNTTHPKVYECACPVNYGGNNSQDCDTLITDLSPNISSFGSSIISSPFYPATYPALVYTVWKIQPTIETRISLKFDPFDVNAPSSSNCVNDYKQIQELFTVHAIASYSMTETEINRACPCIYDMLIVNEGDVTSITNSSAVYCTANPPPSTLHFENTNGVTIMFRTDQTTYTPTGTGEPGFQIAVAVGNCVSTPCLNGGSCTEIAGSFSCVCAGNYTGDTCQRCIPGTHCAGADPCLSSPCLHGGTCQTGGDGTYTCMCASPWSGKSCEDAEDGISPLPIALTIVLILIAVCVVIFLIIYCYKRKSTGGKAEYQLQSKTDGDQSKT